MFVLTGCGGRVDTGAEGDAAIEDAAGGPVADTSPSVVEASAAEVPKDPPPPPPPPPPSTDGPTITSIDACPSAPGVDKIILHASEPMAALPAGKPLTVTPGGTTCPVIIDDRSPTGEYAFGAKCGTIDLSKPIVVVIGSGVQSVTGAPMEPGTYTFRPTGKTGRLCGADFRL